MVMPLRDVARNDLPASCRGSTIIGPAPNIAQARLNTNLCFLACFVAAALVQFIAKFLAALSLEPGMGSEAKPEANMGKLRRKLLLMRSAYTAPQTLKSVENMVKLACFGGTL